MDDLEIASREHPALVDFTRLVDVERRTIDADAWLSSLSPWYRAACSAIVGHWARILALPRVVGDADAWLRDLRGAAARLTAPTVGVRRARGVVEWRHPRDRPEDGPLTGICWMNDASSGLGGAYLCWTSLSNLVCLGGPHWTRDLSTITPRGGAAEDIVAHVTYRLAMEGR